MLEVNDHPSLNIYFTDNNSFEHQEYTDADICQVDYYVKSRLVQDTLDLVRKTKSAVVETNEWRSLTKIHPVAADSIYQTVRDLR